jgi:hypothetical protein
VEHLGFTQQTAHRGVDVNTQRSQECRWMYRSFLHRGDDAVWHIWQTTPGNGWGTWFSSGKPTPTVGWAAGTLCVESNPDGRLEVFATGMDGALWHIWQLTPNGTWSSWASLGNPPYTSVTNPGSGTNADGRIEVFSIGNDLLHVWQLEPGGNWSNWNSLGRPVAGFEFGPPIVSRNADGRLEVFVAGHDGSFYHIWQTSPGGTWSNWFLFGAPGSAPLSQNGAVAQNKDGHLEFLVGVEDGSLWHKWQVTPGGTWGDWYSLGMPPGTQSGTQFDSSPCVITNADGRLEAFICNTDGALWHTWQVTPGGEWGS